MDHIAWLGKVLHPLSAWYQPCDMSKKWTWDSLFLAPLPKEQRQEVIYVIWNSHSRCYFELQKPVNFLHRINLQLAKYTWIGMVSLSKRFMIILDACDTFLHMTSQKCLSFSHWQKNKWLITWSKLLSATISTRYTYHNAPNTYFKELQLISFYQHLQKIWQVGIRNTTKPNNPIRGLFFHLCRTSHLTDKPLHNISVYLSKVDWFCDGRVCLIDLAEFNIPSARYQPYETSIYGHGICCLWLLPKTKTRLIDWVEFRGPCKGRGVGCLRLLLLKPNTGGN